MSVGWAVRLYGRHAEKDPRALSGRRAQTGTLVRGGGKVKRRAV